MELRSKCWNLRGFVQSEVANAALYRDVVKSESDNDGVCLHFFVSSADPRPPYSSLMGLSAKVLLRNLRKFCGKCAEI